MNTARNLALLAAAVVLQVTLLGRLDPSLPQPNLVLAMVLARAWVRGGHAGMRWAVGGGLLLDLAGTGPLGAHALALLAAAYAAGVLAASFENDARVPWLALVAGGAGGAVYGVVLLALADTLGLAQVSFRAAAPLVLGGTVTAALLVPPVAAVMARLAGRRGVAMPAW